MKKTQELATLAIVSQAFISDPLYVNSRERDLYTKSTNLTKAQAKRRKRNKISKKSRKTNRK